MWKFAAILILAAFCVNAEEEQANKNGQQSSSLVQTALCYVSPKPWDCVKEQAGRTLNTIEQTVENKRHELMVQADEEMQESESSRGLTDEEKKEKPSQLMGAVDKGFSAIANMMTDEFSILSGRESRALKKQNKDVDDDSNDFNEDYSLIDAFSRAEAEGKGKKGKKHKKGMMKMFLLGAIVKSKIELLLKVLSFHLQLKFFAIALASLVINLARFWVDLKKQPQKVVYVEHAQHQHHYDEHSDDWGSSWKRQSPSQELVQDSNFAHRLAYNNGPQQYHQN